MFAVQGRICHTSAVIMLDLSMPLIKPDVRSSLRTHLAVLSLVLLGGYVFFSVWHGHNATESRIEVFRQNHNARYRQLIKSEVDRTLHFIDHELGADPTPETIQRISLYLETVRFGNGDKLFGYDCSGEEDITLFGVYPSGTNLKDVDDPVVYQKLKDLKQKAIEGGGYLEYYFHDEAKSDQRHKISYIAPMTPRQWYVGAGTYIPNIEAEIEVMANEAHAALAGELVGGMFCIFAVLIALRAVTKGNVELQVSERRHKAYVGHAPYAIFITDAGGQILHVNQAATTQTGHDQATLKSMRFIDLMAPRIADRQHANNSFQTLIHDGEMESEERALHQGGYEYTLALRSVRLSDDRYMTFGIDVSERIAAEQRQTRLMLELDHRVKNTLASVIALIKQTDSYSKSHEDFVESINHRIMAMSRTYEALAKTKWSDTPLRKLVALTLPEFDESVTGPIQLNGPEVLWRSEAAPPLCMTINELATNARKYGALSKPGGSIDIQWQYDSQKQLTLQWVERGGPPIKHTPQPGFGITLIKGFIEYELAGQVEFNYDPLGFECHISIPTDLDNSG